MKVEVAWLLDVLLSERLALGPLRRGKGSATPGQLKAEVLQRQQLH